MRSSISMLCALLLNVLGLMLATSAFAAPVATTVAINDLAYAAQPDSSLYVTGKHQGKPVNMVRSGALGSGKWVVYVGAMNDRVRFTFDDKIGLQEILAMDKGQRVTLNTVGRERVEYRLYAADRSFIIGSVLYRKDARWLQGLMRSEAFSGYAALSDVSDVTTNVGAQSATPMSRMLAWLKRPGRGFSLISNAHAGTADDLIKGFFSSTAQDAGGFFGAPLDEMWKGALVGAGAFTVKLAGQMIAAGEVTALGSALVAASPFIVAVGTGVVVGLAAEKAYNWAEAKNLGGSASARVVYNRLVAGTRFSQEPAPRVPAPASVEPALQEKTSAPTRSAASAAPTAAMSLLDMADMLDNLDKLDLANALEAADRCTSRRDFDCTNIQLAKAAKSANGSRDKLALDFSRQKMANEKSRIDEEQRQRAEQQRQRAQLERQREQERISQAERESGFQWGKALALGVGAGIGGIDMLGSEAQTRILAGIVRDSQAGQTGMSNTQAGIDSLRPAAPANADARKQGSSGVSPSANQSAGTASCLQAGQVVVSDANVPPQCAKGRQNAFGWGNTQDAACRGAQNEVRDGFGGTNPSGCYCKANARVNSVVQPFVCWVIFD